MSGLDEELVLEEPRFGSQRQLQHVGILVGRRATSEHVPLTTEQMQKAPGIPAACRVSSRALLGANRKQIWQTEKYVYKHCQSPTPYNLPCSHIHPLFFQI